MVENFKKVNISEHLATHANKFCKKGTKDFRNLSQMTDFALRQLIEKLEARED